ncbi:hypothetical protein HB838_14205 [Listeria seeligeri]|uniref:hypothetical protein n=1 Tax=Listeria seeligeri TaxID=1640 RepID=UPI001628FA3A|nr:hypothetical protein [Listeria seeligeri]MBC2030597.1 hypothetical protein [Listeria seeligeri]MBC6115989.1 hypothetical protein [Listeria seeligeri]
MENLNHVVNELEKLLIQQNKMLQTIVSSLELSQETSILEVSNKKVKEKITLLLLQYQLEHDREVFEQITDLAKREYRSSLDYYRILAVVSERLASFQTHRLLR